MGRCGKRPDRLQPAEEHLCLLVYSPVGYKRGEFNICCEEVVVIELFSSVMFNYKRFAEVKICRTPLLWEKMLKPASSNVCADDGETLKLCLLGQW